MATWIVIVSSAFVFGWLCLKQPRWVARGNMTEDMRNWHDFRDRFGIQPDRFDCFLELKWKKIVQEVVDEVLTARARNLHEACERQAASLERWNKMTDTNPEHVKEAQNDLKEEGELVKRRKEDFWPAHALAKGFRYDVHPKHTDYLKNEESAPANA